MAYANNWNFSDSDYPVWDTFSVQYMALAIFPMVLVLDLLRDISKMVKMAVFGFAALCIYVVFIIFIFI